MEGSPNQTSAYITPTHTNIPSANISKNNTHLDWDQWNYIRLITQCLIFSFTFPGICLSVYGLYSLLNNGQFVPVYVINLFISDIIQTTVKLIDISDFFLCKKIRKCSNMLFQVTLVIYITGVLVNICFMVCISAERYVMIAHPVWHRNINTIKISVFVSLTVWVITVAIMTITWLHFYLYFEIFVLLFLLLPYPLVIFFFVGTWRALSRNVSIPHDDQRRIIGILALVLCIYTVLFLPYVVAQIDFFTNLVNLSSWIYLRSSAEILIALNPLFDFLVYLLMRRDAKNILRALFFCCRERHEQNGTTETFKLSVLT